MGTNGWRPSPVLGGVLVVLIALAVCLALECVGVPAPSPEHRQEAARG